MIETEEKNKQRSVCVRRGKKYDLFWLDGNLCRAGIHGKVLEYRLSGDASKLLIVYLDGSLQKQFMYVFRTSRLCYRIVYKTKFISARTCKAATSVLLDILSDIVQLNEYYHVLTVAELIKMDSTLSDSVLPHKKRMDLFRRLEKLQEESQNPKKPM